MAVYFVKKRDVASPYKNGCLIYRIWYEDEIVYIGYTLMPLFKKLHHHFFHKKGNVYLDIHQTTMIDYTTYRSKADMLLYVAYWVNVYHPRLNKTSPCYAPDNLTVVLPNRRWTRYTPRLMEKWKSEIKPGKISGGSPAKPSSLHCAGEASDSLPPIP